MPDKKKVAKGKSALDAKEEVVSNEGALAPQLSEPIEDTVVVGEKEAPMSEIAQVNKSSRMSVRGVVILLVLLILASIPAFYFYMQYKKMQESLHPTAAAQAHVTSLLAQVGKLMLLPSDEIPTVYQVTDVSKLADKAFFANAAYGDEVLIYAKTRKAIIFRPSMGKIINVGPVNIQTAQESAGGPTDKAVAGASTSAVLSPMPGEVKVALYNGTNTSGLTRKAEPLVKAVNGGIKIVAKENAAKNTYEKTQVIILTNDSVIAPQIQAAVKGEASTLPEGEVRPDADILIILGADFSK